MALEPPSASAELSAWERAWAPPSRLAWALGWLRRCLRLGRRLRCRRGWLGLRCRLRVRASAAPALRPAWVDPPSPQAPAERASAEPLAAQAWPSPRASASGPVWVSAPEAAQQLVPGVEPGMVPGMVPGVVRAPMPWREQGSPSAQGEAWVQQAWVQAWPRAARPAPAGARAGAGSGSGSGFGGGSILGLGDAG